ncbi:PKD domain-containing protein [Candidatus Gracilibacteria bacterium]|nr:PKD domain-containing protein [Candidatus Gracilibacteria bacterium]MCF7818977.1 PKD domain-containing protein [Candidatus Gracilibacteria bacterium]
MGEMGEEIWGDITGKGVPDGEFKLPNADEFNQIGQNTSLREYILNVLNFLLSFLGILAVAMIIYAGFLYVTAQGDDAQADKAKNIVAYAAIGVLVILVSYALVNTLIVNAPVGGDDRAECGNGIIEIGEDCDDGGGNVDGVTDACPTSCRATCGNGIKEKGEECEFSIDSPDPDCSRRCRLEEGGGDIPGSGEVIDVSGNIEIGGAGGFGNTAIVSLEQAQAGLDFSLSVGEIESLLWNFGDGIQEELSGTSATTHQFGTEKNYAIKVFAENSNGDRLIGSKNLIVGGIQAGFSVSKQNPIVGESVTFNAGSSSTAVGSIVSYGWECTGGAGCFAPGTGEQFTTSFSEAGDHTVTLTVTTNVNSMTASTSKDISVQSDMPVADPNFSWEQSGGASNPAQYAFDASGSRNLSGGTTGLTYHWDFAGVQKTTSYATFSYTFPSPGDKTITLFVSQNYGGQTRESDPVTKTVSGVQTLAVDFTVPVEPLDKDEIFTFRAQSPGAEAYAWTFPTEATVLDPITIPNVRASFTQAGPHEITLTGTKAGETNSRTKTIYVREEGVFIAIPVVTVNGISQEDPTSVTIQRNDAVSFSSNSLDEFGNTSPHPSTMTETWSVDGTIVSGPAQIPSRLNDVQTYAIRLKVSRPGDPSVGDTAEFPVLVENIPPTVDSVIEDHSVPANTQVTINASDEDGVIDQYTFQLLEAGEIKESQILTEKTTYFNLNNQGSGEHWFYFKGIAEDNDGDTASEQTAPFMVLLSGGNVPPEVTGPLSASPSSAPDVGQEVTFSVDIQDEDGDSLHYTWDFGDGNTDTGTLPPSDQVQTISTSHTYENAGSVQVILTIDDQVSDPVDSSPLDIQVQAPGLTKRTGMRHYDAEK